jgi:Uma2 family endonuclease
VPTEPIWQLTVEQYHEMYRAGILDEDDPVELLEGWLVPKMMKKPPHSEATELIRRALDRQISEGWHVRSEQPVTLATSEPEPDVMVVRGGVRDYPDRHPGANEVALVVEVADASLQRDQVLKKRIYAAAGVTTYWIVNLLERRLEAYSDPSGPAEPPDYHTRHDFGPGDSVPLAIVGREVARIAVSDLLP